MSYRENLEMCFKSGQTSAAEYQAHVASGELAEKPAPICRKKLEQHFISAQLASGHAVTEKPAASAQDARLDRVIYEIDAVMNGYDLDTAQHMPSFMDEHMVRMRAILLKLRDGQAI